MLLNGLALLTTNLLAGIADAFALIRLRRVKAANVRCHLSDQFLVDALDCKLGVVGNRNFDLFRDVEQNGVRESQTQVEFRALDRGLKTDAFDLELLGKAFAYA